MGESYQRHEDWWKQPEDRSEDTWGPPAKVLKSGRYRIRTLPRNYTFRRKAKTWSIVPLIADPKDRTEAEKKFRHYAARWKEETGGDSSLTNITNNMNYLRIIRIGDEAIPLILRELQREPAPWFVALRAISENDSIGRDSPGDFRKMAAAWLQWGKGRGYI